MKITRVRAVIAAATWFFAGSLSSPSHAGSLIYGSWSGIEYHFTQFYSNGQQDGSSGWSMPATFSFSYDTETQDLSMSIGSTSYSWQPGPFDSVEASFGPSSGSGMGIHYPYYYPVGLYVEGNFSATYRSILPDGKIDSTFGSASAIMVLTDFDLSGNGQITQIYFFSVPEPPSVVGIGSGLLGTCVLWYGRRFLRIRWRQHNGRHVAWDSAQRPV
jgi:hypothetical protein